MAQFDKRIDAYIEKARDFAKPVLDYLRNTVHTACPGAKETIKWGVPYFEYEGKILCGMASFKEHCAFMFRLGSMMKDPGGYMETSNEKTGMGHFGKIRSLEDLPREKILIQYVREAMELTESGAKIPRQKTTGKELVVPEDFLKMLRRNKSAYHAFSKFSPSHKKEYVEWITGAKRVETRNKRIATAVKLLDEGKTLSWKYDRR